MAGFLEYVFPKNIQANPSALQPGFSHAMATS